MPAKKRPGRVTPKGGRPADPPVHHDPDGAAPPPAVDRRPLPTVRPHVQPPPPPPRRAGFRGKG